MHEGRLNSLQLMALQWHDRHGRAKGTVTAGPLDSGVLLWTPCLDSQQRRLAVPMLVKSFVSAFLAPHPLSPYREGACSPCGLQFVNDILLGPVLVKIASKHTS